VTKSLQDFRITLERVAMAAKWTTTDQKKEVDGGGGATCEGSLKLADQALNGAREQEIAEQDCQKYPRADKINW
jgi:hypothetical protein